VPDAFNPGCLLRGFLAPFPSFGAFGEEDHKQAKDQQDDPPAHAAAIEETLLRC
jgi:hypothetical protein